MKSTTVKCWRCKGKGSVKLSNALLEVLKQATAWPDSGVTASYCQNAINIEGRKKVGITAYNNRLERLFKMGLLKRERDGRTQIYFPTKLK